MNQVSEKQSKEASLNSLVKRQLAKSSSKLWLGLLGLIDLTLETIILGRGSLVLFRLILLFTPPLFPRFRRFRTFTLFVISAGKSSKGKSEGSWGVWRPIKNSRSYRWVPVPCPPCPPCSTPGDKNTPLTKVLLKANTTTSTFTIVTDFIFHHSQTTLHSPGTFRDV